jgi:hypothetical protein
MCVSLGQNLGSYGAKFMVGWVTAYENSRHKNMVSSVKESNETSCTCF